jgi:hypothetical protein
MMEATAVIGKWMLVCSAAVLLSTMLALAVYVLRMGVSGDADVRPSVQPFGPRSVSGQSGFSLYKGRSRLKVMFSRERNITMDSLVDGTATRGERAVVIAVQVAFVSFWFVFLGGALTLVADTSGLSLFLPAVVGLWLFGILAAQWRDLNAARRKLARSKKTRRPA